MDQTLQNARVSDFRSRADYASDTVYAHLDGGWQYIPRHPFADELSLLRDLALKPCDCRSVDAWCYLNDDAALLQVFCVGYLPNRTKGFYACRTDSELGHCDLTAVVESETITRSIFESVMVQFVEYGFPSGSLFTNMSIGETITLTTQDGA